jgi:hypothetical protein
MTVGVIMSVFMLTRIGTHMADMIFPAGKIPRTDTDAFMGQVMSSQKGFVTYILAMFSFRLIDWLPTSVQAKIGMEQWMKTAKFPKREHCTSKLVKRRRP